MSRDPKSSNEFCATDAVEVHEKSTSMGSPVDLTLGRRSNESPSSNKGFHNDNRRSLKEPAQEYLRSLREERRKVEGFKRELPACIQLLDDAIKSAEEKLIVHVLPEKENDIIMSPGASRRPMLEEFMPLKTRRERDDQSSDISSDGEPDYCGTKKRTQPAWMAEGCLWNQTTAQAVCEELTRDPEHSEQERSSVTSSQQRLSGGGAFLPFQQSVAMPVVSRPKPRSGGFCADLNLNCVQGLERSALTTLPLRAAVSEVEVGSTEAAAAAAHVVPGNSVAVPGTAMSDRAGNCHNISSGGDRVGGIPGSSTRKTRRCWSPELHRRFVSALQQLGGSHIATPKQLRELMKVDGLTNDEVKSHLQKYRLHTGRRPSSSFPHESGQQLVVVGGIWMPPQQTVAASPPGSQSGVSDPSQFCHATDYIAACINNCTPAAVGSAPLQTLQLHRQPLFDSPQPGTSQSQTSPQGPLQVTSQLSGATQGSSSDTYESGEEEARSQNTSWNKLCSQSRTIEVRR